MFDFVRARKRMVDVDITGRGISSHHVLQAMQKVPREQFVDAWLKESAYEDRPLPIAEGQTISQPYIVAVMLEAADIKPESRVLEIGAGSGYAAAVMSRIAEQVYTIERHAVLGESARKRFEKLDYDNIQLRIDDGTKGWPEAGPFDAIIVAASGQSAPQALKEQLKIGGRLIIPLGDEFQSQELVRMIRINKVRFDEESLGAVRFVPLLGKRG
ncbi:protein-L-isoaspartate(D-aspartate) O-methyltransferase [Phyllobacterium ifriqiyense]|uniref:Protein-L-isoaspartate O-methyltransferase n=1 Tax=Phyllobacterium ifriqiyense TaxID=314238 RepID=A0ABU0S4B7_9HYPH|nr:protein-L-isoaspartate(D-aspartate) O-methyltransferase [Phyllobacterium ifriqiyense]MDQ0995600.1 protein-L-isoaspartate(D-aspartate) O-methyltransferase [Phyllobacterium ifriqiyense]